MVPSAAVDTAVSHAQQRVLLSAFVRYCHASLHLSRIPSVFPLRDQQRCVGGSTPPPGVGAPEVVPTHWVTVVERCAMLITLS